MPRVKLNNDRAIKALATKLPQEDFYDTTWSNTGGFGVRVSRTGRKVFFICYTPKGKKKRKRFTMEKEYPGLSLAAAKEEALQLIVGVRSGEDPSEEKQQHKLAETVSELFYDVYVPHKQGVRWSPR